MSALSHNSRQCRLPTTLLGARLGTLKQVQTPAGARWFARSLLVIFFVSPVLLIFLPWQQSVYGTGRLIALDPTERQQEVEAPIDGRILKWHVQEGQRVRGPVYSDDGKLITEGDLLVSMQDPDPQLTGRLALQREAILERKKAASERIGSFTQQIQSLENSREQALKAARNRLQMSEERYKAAREAVVAAGLQRELAATNFKMEAELIKDGLTSQLVYVTAKQRKEQTEVEERRAVNARDAASVEVEALRAEVEKIRNDAEAAISSAKASKQSAEAELATAMRDLADIDTRIARQACQEVKAPCDGVVYRVLCNAHRGGALVKAGEKLVTITPDIGSLTQRTVELFLDGNDAPQLTELWRRRQREGNTDPLLVRIQFEGWPAIQSVGWPSIAWGTFGGKVVLVDPHDDGKGRFRILVQPDEQDEPWPSEFSLRQGTRAQGWVLLDRVSLGYEVWRRFNGFPPVVAGKDYEDEYKPKPGKVKVPK